MSAVPTPASVRRFTIQEYLESEYVSPSRREFHDGRIVDLSETQAMAGGSPMHSLVTANLIGSLFAALQGKPCRAYDANLRIRPAGESFYFYPDCSVVCGPLEFDPADTHQQTVINPTVVIEVVSPSTEAFDRGEKFAKYRQIESLRHYVIASLTSPSIDIYTRKADGSWLFAASHGLENHLTLDAIGVSVPLGQVYAEVVFEAA